MRTVTRVLEARQRYDQARADGRALADRHRAALGLEIRAGPASRTRPRTGNGTTRAWIRAGAPHRASPARPAAVPSLWTVHAVFRTLTSRRPSRHDHEHS